MYMEPSPSLSPTPPSPNLPLLPLPSNPLGYFAIAKAHGDGHSFSFNRLNDSPRGKNNDHNSNNIINNTYSTTLILT